MQDKLQGRFRQIAGSEATFQRFEVHVSRFKTSVWKAMDS